MGISLNTGSAGYKYVIIVTIMFSVFYGHLDVHSGLTVCCIVFEMRTRQPPCMMWLASDTPSARKSILPYITTFMAMGNYFTLLIEVAYACPRKRMFSDVVAKIYNNLHLSFVLRAKKYPAFFSSLALTRVFGTPSALSS